MSKYVHLDLTTYNYKYDEKDLEKINTSPLIQDMIKFLINKTNKQYDDFFEKRPDLKKVAIKNRKNHPEQMSNKNIGDWDILYNMYLNHKKNEK